ncbi:NADH-ubiquinone oxidoreductase-F iron-sulfur binding region domain-containing protein [Desulfosarcina ovata]|uniref:NADH-quinone oxidoreductase subunit F n=1 Tax=Desulfosarcina ovata subsp. ovata TaxID=2752305 RepID=A0A5K8AIM1_9BACT|nr:NADH-ubiquinone oxidoreductase-F iron-sulfur binding region domain-containing protein [Desulfosarcina ovata]BBO92408.1 NADH-quinone oxidoreductase subunit F [Desulfosarcina ovata subsp. ovata]
MTADDSPIRTAYQVLADEATARKEAFDQSPLPKIHIGMATCGIASGALETQAAFETALAERGVEAHVHTVGCVGHCYAEPVVVIDHPDSGFPPILYPEVTPGKAKMLVKLFLEEGDPRFEHIMGATVENEMIPSVTEFARFNREKRVIMDRCGRIDPEQIHEYLADGGYHALVEALCQPPEALIDTIEAAGLRGRGGAGFPTGRKWRFARAATGTDKLIVCNADEGDPGAYMDRTLLESNPHQVIEGMLVAAIAVGATGGLFYVRAEYPLAVRILTQAIEQARECGVLGKNILGSGMDFDIDLFQGSGAFVCGEETALIHSVEGYRGMPRHRPPFPVERGLDGRPTVINNVKTLATVPPIVEKGADWFRGIGTADSPGTAVFSVVGNVTHPGLVEIPMGVTLRELIFDICGGIPNKKKFKAVQIGGPSGGCLSADFLDTPVDFDALTRAGAMMGSGGMVVMDEDACMVDVSRFFLDFTQKESCGKCTFCRIGTRHLLDILRRITRGEGREGDIEQLESLSRAVKAGSLCGLGKTAPNPVLTSLAYFRDEYEAHIKEGRCPGRACRPLTAFYIDLEKCARGCDACVGCCPVDAVFTTSNRKKGIDQSLCVKCGECMVACPPDYDAVVKISPAHLAPVIERPPEKKD